MIGFTLLSMVYSEVLGLYLFLMVSLTSNTTAPNMELIPEISEISETAVEIAWAEETPMLHEEAQYYSHSLAFVLTGIMCFVFLVVMLMRQLSVLRKEFEDQKKTQEMKYEELIQKYDKLQLENNEKTNMLEQQTDKAKTLNLEIQQMKDFVDKQTANVFELENDLKSSAEVLSSLTNKLYLKNNEANSLSLELHHKTELCENQAKKLSMLEHNVKNFQVEVAQKTELLSIETIKANTLTEELKKMNKKFKCVRNLMKVL